MFVDERRVHHRLSSLPLVLLLVLPAIACDDGTTTRVAAPEGASYTSQQSVTDWDAVLEVTVRKTDRSAAVGSIVTVVVPPGPDVPESEWKHWGPIQHAKVGSDGVVNFQDLPTGARACVHVRSDISLTTAQEVALYPAPRGTTIAPPEGDSTQAAVLTGANRRAVPFTPENYLEFCVEKPPLVLATQGGHTKITLQHELAARVNVQVLDLLGHERSDVQRGVVTGGFINDSVPVFTCGQIPWLKYDDSVCTKDVPPGFLHSTRENATPLSVAKGVPFRVEALGLVKIGDNDVELVATKGYAAAPTGVQTLVGENLVCVGGSKEGDHIFDEIGNASAMDIQGLVKFSVGVNYGVGLSPDPSRTAVWFNMTPDDGSVTYSSRTVPKGTNQTRSYSLDFTARNGPDGYTCTVTGESGQLVNLKARGAVYCDPASQDGLVRVTIIQRDLPAWTSHEFSVRTFPDQGSGDSTWDPDRSGASRAFVPIPHQDECTVPGGNDDRLAVRI